MVELWRRFIADEQDARPRKERTSMRLYSHLTLSDYFDLYHLCKKVKKLAL